MQLTKVAGNHWRTWHIGVKTMGVTYRRQDTSTSTSQSFPLSPWQWGVVGAASVVVILLLVIYSRSIRGMRRTRHQLHQVQRRRRNSAGQERSHSASIPRGQNLSPVELAYPSWEPLELPDLPPPRTIPPNPHINVTSPELTTSPPRAHQPRTRLSPEQKLYRDLEEIRRANERDRPSQSGLRPSNVQTDLYSGGVADTTTGTDISQPGEPVNEDFRMYQEEKARRLRARGVREEMINLYSEASDATESHYPSDTNFRD